MKKLRLLLFLLLPLPLLAQTGSLTGVALDGVGNTVAGATITVCPQGSSGIPCSPVTATTTSNGQGAFSVTVPVGTYTVTVFRTGIVATSSTVVVAPSNITVANNVTYTGSVAFTGNNSHGGTETFTAPLTGLTTNTQWNGVNTVNPTGNSVNFNTEFQFGQGVVGTSDLFSLGMSVPAAATTHSANVLSCFQNTFSTTTNAVCGYFQNRLMATGAHGWAINPIFEDNGFAGTGTAAQFDCNITNTGTSGSCIQISGSGTGSATLFPAIRVSKPSGTQLWASIFSVDAGAAPYTYNTSVAAPEALTVNTGSSGNGYFTLFNGNLGMQSGFSNFGAGNNFQFFMQGRNNVGTNNIAYPMMLQPLGGPLCVNTTSITNCANNGTGLTIGSGSPLTSSGNGGTAATLAGPETLTNKTLTSPTFSASSLTLAQTTANYTLSWANPAAARTLTVPDPLASDTFAFLTATQTLTNKSTSAGPLTGTVASGTATMTTAAITAGNCGTTVTVAATGVAITDTIIWAFNAAPAGSNAGLVAWPTANNVNFAYCGIAETPAAATINWRIVR